MCKKFFIFGGTPRFFRDFTAQSAIRSSASAA